MPLRTGGVEPGIANGPARLHLSSLSPRGGRTDHRVSDEAQQRRDGRVHREAGKQLIAGRSDTVIADCATR